MEKKTGILWKIAYGSFYIGVIIETLIVLVDKSDFINPIEGRLFQLTFLLFFIKVCLTRYTWKEYLTIFLFGVLGAVSYFVTGRNEIVRFVIFIAACKDIDMDQCLKRVFYLTLAGCMLIVFLSLTGIYGNVSMVQDFGRDGVETRYILGMGHPNALQCMIWALTVLGLYLYGEKLRWYYYILVFAVNVGFFFLTDSKTSLLTAVFTAALAFVVSRKSVWIKKAGAAVCMSVTAFSIWFSVLIAGNAQYVYNYYMFSIRPKESLIWVKIDNMLTGRLYTLAETKGLQGVINTWSLFAGRKNDYYFDLGWIRLFYWYGIIPALVFIAVLFTVMLYFQDKKQYMALMMITSFALYTIIEAHAVSVYLGRNYILFLFGACWYKMVSESEDAKTYLRRKLPWLQKK